MDEMITARKRQPNKLTVVVAAVLIVIGLGLALISREAKADVVLPGSQSSGSTGDCNGGNKAGCPWTSNGHGWRKIPIGDANGPNGNNRWNGAVDACSKDGATHIIAFLIFTGEKTQKTAWIYNFSYSKYSDSLYNFNGGMHASAAESKFITLSADARQGYSFGSNVGLFCWNDKWTISLSTVVDKPLVPNSTMAVAEPGERITWTHTLKNDGGATTNQSITWRYKKQGDFTEQGPEVVWASGQAKDTTTLQSSSYDVTAGDIGKVLCQFATANPKASDNTGETSSEQKCVLIAKRPKVQILGSDLIVGRPFTGSSVTSEVATSIVQKPATTAGQGTVFGSWVEYGIFATGTVTNTGSGSAFGGSGGTSTQKCIYSRLSFANTNNTSACIATSTIGAYNSNRTIPNIAGNFPVRAGLTSIYDDSNAKPQGLYTSNDHGTPQVSDPITLGARTLTRGQWFVINAPDAEVTINGNITYEDGPFNSVADIPQLIIIAQNIHIVPSVSRVDAWLIARGSTSANTGILDTCAIDNNYSTQLTISPCSTVLTVNGPVMAQKVWYRRTGGSMTGTDKGGPAEIFTLRPDAYLWMYARSSTSGRVESVYTRELPPRF